MPTPLLYVLCTYNYTHDCASSHQSNTIIKFADDTSIVGLISRDAVVDSADRDEVEQLTVRCRENNPLPNTKTKELIIAFRKNQADMLPLTVIGGCVERVANFRFL